MNRARNLFDTNLGVQFTDADHGLVVGPGDILRTENGGTTWVAQEGARSHMLNAVVLDAEGTAIAVGLQGMIMTTADAGDLWTYVSSRCRLRNG